MEPIRFDLAAWESQQNWTTARTARELGLSRWTINRMKDAGAVPKYIWLALQALENGKHNAR